jgi:lipopolysaccharide transport system permease protein
MEQKLTPLSTIDTNEITVIRPLKGWSALGMFELWQYRELLYFMAWRDIKVRYKQTVIGILWAIIQPFMTMIVFTLFFGRMAQLPTDGLPYPIFYYAGLLPWTFFSGGIRQASNSLIEGSNMVKRVYFPRMVMPIGAILSLVLDFALAFLLLLGMMVYYGLQPTVNVIWLPLLLVLAFITALGIGLWLSALNVQFRDIRYALPFLIQLWLFITPVVYPASLLSESWRAIYALNPMVGVVEGFRWALLGTDTRPGFTIVISTVTAIILLLSGAFYFKRVERTFADVI